MLTARVESVDSLTRLFWILSHVSSAISVHQNAYIILLTLRLLYLERERERGVGGESCLESGECRYGTTRQAADGERRRGPAGGGRILSPGAITLCTL